MTDIIVIGAGPAGLVCAYYLAKNGYAPILLERGKCIEERQKDVEKFWKTGELNPQSNVFLALKRFKSSTIVFFVIKFFVRQQLRIFA